MFIFVMASVGVKPRTFVFNLFSYLFVAGIGQAIVGPRKIQFLLLPNRRATPARSPAIAGRDRSESIAVVPSVMFPSLGRLVRHGKARFSVFKSACRAEAQHRQRPAEAPPNKNGFAYSRARFSFS
jgi:hypothetical protein